MQYEGGGVVSYLAQLLSDVLKKISYPFIYSFICSIYLLSMHIFLQHGQRVTGMDWAAKSNQLVTCAAVSFNQM